MKMFQKVAFTIDSKAVTERTVSSCIFQKKGEVGKGAKITTHIHMIKYL